MRNLGKIAACLCAAIALTGTAAQATQYPVSFNLTNIGGAAPGTQAYYGFNAAAAFWSSKLTTSQPVTINLNIGFTSLGPNILGSTSSSYVSTAIVNVENRILARQSGSFDAATTLPTLGAGDYGPGTALDVYTPGYTGTDLGGNPIGIDNSKKVYDTDGGVNNTFIAFTTANAKALGYVFSSSIVDATIQFSSDFAFDFRPGDGIDADKSDFLGVAIHEIGHALGFDSGVDSYDYLGTGGAGADMDCGGGTLCKDYPANDDVFGQTLDLFRYSAPGKLDWTTDTASYFSIDGGLTAYQGGYFSTGEFNGDGWQASHWKAPQLPNGDFSCLKPKLGVLNPYLCDGQNGIVTGLDLAALDAIGWNTTVDLSTYAQSTRALGSLIPVPEPATWAIMLFGFGAIGSSMRYRRGSAIPANA